MNYHQLWRKRFVKEMSFKSGVRVLQESLAVADKPARRESMPKIAPIRRAYNVVADNRHSLSSFV